MDLNNISTTIKDTSRSIYIQLMAGKISAGEQLHKALKDLEHAIAGLKPIILLDSFDYTQATKSDLRGLAEREAQQ